MSSNIIASRRTAIQCLLAFGLLFCIVSQWHNNNNNNSEAFVVATSSLITSASKRQQQQQHLDLLSPKDDGTSDRQPRSDSKITDASVNPLAKSSPSPSSLPSFQIEKYHLLWSPGAWKKVATGTAVLFATHSLVNGLSLEHVPGVVRSVAVDLLIPLLASACCFLQLIMNVFALGCGGFNTVLGPVRPYFVSLLIYLIATSMSSPHRGKVASHAVRWAIALLPELLDLWNSRKQYVPFWRSHQSSTSSTARADDTSKFSATVELNIPSMGCVACIHTIDQALSEVPNVHATGSSLKPLGAKGGQAKVEVRASTRSEVNAIVNQLQEAVTRAGFADNVVESVKIKETEAKTLE
jgi:copper chaperone CopZ